MEWPRVAVDAAVFAASIRVDAGLEPDIRAVVIGNDRFGFIPKKLGARQRILLWIPILVAFEMNLLETIRRIFSCAARWQRCGLGCHEIIIAADSVGEKGVVNPDFGCKSSRLLVTICR